MDNLSLLLDSLTVRTAAIGHFDFGAPWSLAMDYAPAHGYVVARGKCWLELPGHKPRPLEEGDAVVLVRGGACVLCSDPGRAPMPWAAVWEQGLPDVAGFDPRESLPAPVRLSWQPGAERTHLLALALGFQDEVSHPLLTALPDLLVVPRPAQRSAWSDAALAFLTEEAAAGQPGYAALARPLAALLFTDLLRRHVLASPALDSGWLRGLGDPAVARALRALHHDPGRDWTVAALAAQAGLSRTIFAARFAASLGQTPMAYLTVWRMHCARDLLAARRPVGEVAARLGYHSERAFREAFKRSSGMAPQAYALTQRRQR